MLQAFIKKGKVLPENVPIPQVSEGNILIKVVNSCISVGTETSCVKNSGKSIIQRVIEEPQNLKKAIDLALQQGFFSIYEKVKNRLGSGSPIGYSVSGIVIDKGSDIEEIKIGDKVAAAGAGFANHAEYVVVPKNLVVKIPNEVSFEHASTVALGSIAMQGIRRADLRFGEYCAVIGCGLLGLLTIQMLVHAGIRVAATDLDSRRLHLAKELGAELTLNPNDDNLIQTIQNWSNGFGVDAVIFTASTSSNEPLSQSFNMCRRKGKVVLVGVSGMQINREDIYSKELDFLISTSYGPGRYDKNYEEYGIDYPYAYVRWTENRNMAEYLRLIQIGAIKLDKIIDVKFHISQVEQAYNELQKEENKPIAVIIEYNDETMPNETQLAEDSKVCVTPQTEFKRSENVTVTNKIFNIALVGAGGFATNMHLPLIEKLSSKYKLYAIMSRTGYKAKEIAQQYNAHYATTKYEYILNDPNVDLILISTTHKSHAELTLQALKAGKNVFVEKPLAINQDELKKIVEFYNQTSSPKPILFVGFNRRFSKYIQEIKKHTKNRINPMLIHYRMNAGLLPNDHWVYQEGGRIIGEACHIIDLVIALTESKIDSIYVESISPKTNQYKSNDNKTFTLKLSDGSIAIIDYFSIGNSKLSKEYMEIHFDGKSIILDDYKLLKGYGLKINEINSFYSQKGHLEEWEALYDTLIGKTNKWPIELWELIQTTEATFLINDN